MFKRFRGLTPQERNEELQALYAAILAEKAEDTGDVSSSDLELLRALQKSFGISIRYDEIKSNDMEGF